MTGIHLSSINSLYLRLRLPLILLGLTAGTAIVFVLRLHTLLAFPYPPSNDAGGDLYSAQQWLGHPIAGVDVSLQPPLYYWVIVIPSVWAFGPFLGPQFYMALVPALLVFPGYLVCRETGAGVPASVLGGTALAIATPFSLMVAWNGGYNAFGILFLTFFIALIARALRTGVRRDCILAGVCLALVAATHELTFVVAVLAFVSVAVVVLAISRQWNQYGRRLFLTATVAVLASLPLIPIYVMGGGETANLGIGGYQNQLNWTLSTFPYFAWGYQSATLTGVLILDIFVAAAGLIALWLRSSTRLSAITLTSVWIGGLAIPFLDASNAVRGLYFLAIPAVLVMPAFFEHLLERPSHTFMPSSDSIPPTAVTSGPVREARIQSLRWRRVRLPRASPRMMAVAAIAAFCTVNACFSLETLNTATQFYSSLSAENVAVLNWLKSETASNATILDTLGVTPWIWGYAHRLAYAPAPLGVESTSASLQRASQADDIWLGSSLMEDGVLTVADNSPSPLGIPSVFVNVPGYWVQMISTQSDLVNFTIVHSNSTYNEKLSSAMLVSNTSQVVRGTSVLANYQFWWAPLGFGVSEDLNLTGQVLSVRWSGLNATLDNSTNWLGIVPPNPAYAGVSNEQNVTSASRITNDYTLEGLPFTLSLSCRNLNLTIQSNGWAYAWCSGGDGWNATFGGLAPIAGRGVAYVDTSLLVKQLRITYFTSDPISDYPVFLRLEHNAIGTAQCRQVFRDGDAYIFSIEWD